MRMINCSRSGVEPLKSWWLMKTVGDKGWTEQAARYEKTIDYFIAALEKEKQEKMK